MNYKSLIDSIEATKVVPVDEVYDVLTQLFFSAKREDSKNDEEDSDAPMFHEKARVLIGHLLGEFRHTGVADDYHNCAVELSRAKKSSEACKLLEKGIGRFPANIDLRADYLVYGVRCENFDKCKTHYATLMSLDMKSWNWRAFDFTFDYLIELFQQTIDSAEREKLSNDMLALIDSMFTYSPNEEYAYLAKSKYYEMIENDEKKRIETLQLAVANATLKMPRCCLALAEYHIDKLGDYDTALTLLSRAKRDNVSTRPTVNQGYLHLISMLCKYSKLLINSENLEKNDFEYEPSVKDIFHEYNIVKLQLGNKEERVQSAKKHIEEIQVRTGLRYSQYEYQED